MSQARFSGEELRERREAMGLRLVDVYKKLHIPVRHVQALEEGDWDSLPASCYVIGYLKTYCELLELEPERLIDQYRACVSPVTSRFLGVRRGTASGASPWAGWLSEALTWAAVCAIIALGWCTYNLVFRPDADGANPRVDADRTGVSEMAVPPPPALEDNTLGH